MTGLARLRRNNVGYKPPQGAREYHQSIRTLSVTENSQGSLHCGVSILNVLIRSEVVAVIIVFVTGDPRSASDQFIDRVFLRLYPVVLTARV
jgi:hypothetical protein